MKTRVVTCVLVVLGLAGFAQADYFFDFQGGASHPGEDEPGATIITPDTPLYSAAQGYGLATSADGGRTRGGTDKLLKDFLFDDVDPIVFRVDMPNGLYEVQSWSGDMDFGRQLRMIISLDGGVTEDILYGCDSANDTPLPGTFMTDFVDSGTPGTYDMTIPDGKSHAGANYNMAATEFLQVHDTISVTGGSLTFMVGSYDHVISGIKIDLIPEPATMMLLGVGALTALRRRRR